MLDAMTSTFTPHLTQLLKINNRSIHYSDETHCEHDPISMHGKKVGYAVNVTTNDENKRGMDRSSRLLEKMTTERTRCIGKPGGGS